MVTRSKPDYTFGELEGIDALESLGIEIQDDAPASQAAVEVIESPGARTERKKVRWQRMAEEHGLTDFDSRSDEELETAVASAQAAIDAGQYDTGDPGDRITLLGYINTARHTLNTRDKTKPEYTGEPLEAAAVTDESTSEGSVEMAQATIRDPDTGETVILTAAKEGDGPTVVTAKSEGEAGPLMAATEAAMEDVAERSAAPSEPVGDAEGSGFEPLPDGFDLSAYGFGDKQDEAPEPATEPDKYELANQHGEMLADQSGLERDSDEWKSVASEGYNAYLDDLEGITSPKMSWAKRVIVPTESGYAVVEPAPAESPATEGQGFEPLPEGFDLSAYGFGDKQDEPSPAADAATGAGSPVVDTDDAETRQQWATGVLKDQWFERSLEARQAEHSGNLITRIEQGMDVPWVGRHELAKEYVESLIGPPDAAKGNKYSFRKQRELHQKLQALAAAGQETASAPDESPESPVSAEPEPETGDTMPASESSAEASEPEPEAPPLAPVLADAEPGPAEPPAVITPTTGKGPPEPPKVASVSRNDTAEQLQQKWKQADQSIDAYAKSYGIAGIPDDAARLELRPDGSIGVERLRVTPQGGAYRTPARQASGSGDGGGGGGSSSAKSSAPAIGLRKSWDRMSLAEKQSVIDVINDALARRALLSSALVTMTCSPTGDLSLSQGQKMATIVGSCVPRSAPVSPRQSLQAHPWLSKHEVATLGGGKRKSGQSQKGKKSNSRR